MRWLVVLALLGALLPAQRVQGRPPAAAAAGSRAAASPRWDFVVRFPDLQGIAEVAWTLHGFASGRLRVCADMDGAGEYVRDLVQLAGESGPAQPLPRDGTCWLATVDGAPTRLRYRYDLRSLARDQSSVDYAEQLGDSFIFNDETLLLRPDPLPRGRPPAAITVEFQLPAGASLTAPYARLAEPGLRFRLDAEQYDGGNYITVGQVASLGQIRLPHTTVDLNVLRWPRRASDAALRGWIETAVGAVDRFYGTLLHDRVHVTLVPVPGSRKPALFGSVMRRGLASVVLYIGAGCERFDFREEWVAVHELFHLGNPLTDGKMSWFVEGFTTYYQDVLRGRLRALTPAATWGDLWDGVRRFCQPTGGASLAEESESLRRTHRYTRVYWGGACVALLTDIAIREHSRGQVTLDDVLRALRQQSLRAPVEEDEVIAALDRAAGRPLVKALLAERRAIAVREALARLGVIPTGDETVELRDDAPLAGLRRAMF
ncbi:MAG: hypothetical protein U1A78_06580 [Polyangia bacterium]